VTAEAACRSGPINFSHSGRSVRSGSAYRLLALRPEHAMYATGVVLKTACVTVSNICGLGPVDTHERWVARSLSDASCDVSPLYPQQVWWSRWDTVSVKACH